MKHLLPKIARSRHAWKVPFLAATWLFLACDPEMSMMGTVERPDGGPVEGAKVSIACKSISGWGIVATTDAKGAFSASNIGCVEKNCLIDVTVSGEPVRHFPSADYCASNASDCCSAIQANLTIPVPGSP